MLNITPPEQFAVLFVIEADCWTLAMVRIFLKCSCPVQNSLDDVNSI